MRTLFCWRRRARAFRARDAGRLNILEVRDSVVGFKGTVRLFEGWLHMTLGKKVGTPAGVNRELLESSAVGMKLIRKPSQVGLPTSVGFATSAHAKCAFLVLQKISRD